MENYYGVVVGILSGDSLIIQFRTKGVTEIQNVCLEHLIAPKFGKTDGQVKDEPHGFDSWNFLRNLCIGQRVSVTPPANKPEMTRKHPAFGQMPVFFSRVGLCSKDGVSDVGLFCVEAGWVRIRSPRVRDAYVNSLYAGEASAKRQNLGIWRENGFVRNLPVRYDAADLLAIGEFDAIVENVINGTTVALFLMPHHEHIVFQVAACRSQSARREGGDELGMKAKNFTVHSLLHRNTRVRLCSWHENGLFFGPIIDRSDRAIRQLISSGLATFYSKTAELAPSAIEYERCECEARAGRKGMWSEEDPTVSHVRTVEGVVQRVLGTSALEIDVRGQNKIVQFSNVRLPPYIPGGGSEPFGFEAREKLRKLVIGETVRVLVDGAIAERYFGTVYLGSVCVNEVLVREGFGRVFQQICGEPSEALPQLNQAQEMAAAEEIGAYGREVEPLVVNDYSFNDSQDVALTQFDKLNNMKLFGVVEDIRGGNRFIVLVPEKKVILRVAVNGLLPLKPSDRLGQEAISFCITHYLNRDIEFELVEVDRGGGFISNMTLIEKNGTRRDIAADLLAEGLAEIHHRTAASMRNFAELKAIQERAQAERIGKWGDESVQETGLEYGVFTACRITNVISPVEMQVQLLSKSMLQVETLMNTPAVPLGSEPVENSLVAVSHNNWFYRGRVHEISGGKARVELIDFGVSIHSPISSLYQMPRGAESIPPQLTTVRLAFLDLIERNEDDVQWIKHDYRQYVLYARVAYFKEQKVYVLLYDSPSIQGGTLNAVILDRADVCAADLDWEVDAEFDSAIDIISKIEEDRQKDDQ